MRKKWKYALADAITVRKVHQESNMVRMLDYFIENVPSPLSQWLAPHDVRTGFYRYLKPGQPLDDKIHILGRITATAPMCKRGLRFGPSRSRGLIRLMIIVGYRRSFMIIGSGTGIYTARRGKSGESWPLSNTRTPTNLVSGQISRRSWTSRARHQYTPSQTSTRSSSTTTMRLSHTLST